MKLFQFYVNSNNEFGTMVRVAVGSMRIRVPLVIYKTRFPP